MTDEVKTIEADAKTVAAEPAKVEVAVKADETKATSWIEKHPNYTAAIAAVAVILLGYAIFKIL